MNSSGRPKQGALMELEYRPLGGPPFNAMLPAKLVAGWANGTKKLLASIESRPPNVTEACQDLQALRDLFGVQLPDSTALRSRFSLTYCAGEFQSTHRQISASISARTPKSSRRLFPSVGYNSFPVTLPDRFRASLGY